MTLEIIERILAGLIILALLTLLIVLAIPVQPPRTAAGPPRTVEPAPAPRTAPRTTTTEPAPRTTTEPAPRTSVGDRRNGSTEQAPPREETARRDDQPAPTASDGAPATEEQARPQPRTAEAPQEAPEGSTQRRRNSETARDDEPQMARDSRTEYDGDGSAASDTGRSIERGSAYRPSSRRARRRDHTATEDCVGGNCGCCCGHRRRTVQRRYAEYEPARPRREPPPSRFWTYEPYWYEPAGVCPD